MKEQAKGFCIGAMIMTLIWELSFVFVPLEYGEFIFLIGMFSFPVLCIIRMLLDLGDGT